MGRTGFLDEENGIGFADFENRIVSSAESPEDSQAELSLRPKTLDEYIGQTKAKENLKIYIDAAKLEGNSRPCAAIRPAGTRKTTCQYNRGGIGL